MGVLDIPFRVLVGGPWLSGPGVVGQRRMEGGKQPQKKVQKKAKKMEMRKNESNPRPDHPGPGQPKKEAATQIQKRGFKKNVDRRNPKE